MIADFSFMKTIKNSVLTIFASNLLAVSTFAGSLNVSDESLGAINHLSEQVGLITKQLSARSIKVQAQSVGWAELETFHSEFLQTMAMDPQIGDNSAELIAKGVESTYTLRARFKDLLKLKSIAKNYGAQEDFTKYTHFVSEVLALRDTRNYTQARSQVKKALLAGVYRNLSETLRRNMEPVLEATIAINPDDQATLMAALQSINTGVQSLQSELKESLATIINNREILAQNQTLLHEYQSRVQWVRGLLAALVLAFVATCALGTALALRNAGRSRGVLGAGPSVNAPREVLASSAPQASPSRSDSTVKNQVNDSIAPRSILENFVASVRQGARKANALKANEAQIENNISLAPQAPKLSPNKVSPRSKSVNTKGAAPSPQIVVPTLTREPAVAAKDIRQEFEALAAAMTASQAAARQRLQKSRENTKFEREEVVKKSASLKDASMKFTQRASVADTQVSKEAIDENDPLERLFAPLFETRRV